jgi:death on curing protein
LSVIQQVSQKFFGVDRYPEIHDKAAALLYFLNLDHLMIEGNKRFAMTAAEVFLKKNGFVWELSTEEYVSIALKIADNRTRPSLQEVCEWMKSKVRPGSV